MAEYMTILIFALTIVCWVAFSSTLGLGVIAIGGTAAYLIAGLVRWEDINSGVNWGVVLLYAAAISFGHRNERDGCGPVGGGQRHHRHEIHGCWQWHGL